MPDSQQGTVPNGQTSRWSLHRNAATGATTSSLLVLATPGLVRKVVITAGATTDVFTIYNNATATGLTAAQEVFVATGLAAGIATVFDLGEGWDCSTGITSSIAGTAAVTGRMFISYDKAK